MSKNKEYLELLKKSFNESKFIEFVTDLLNLDSSDINTDLSEKVITTNQYKDDIKKYKYIAKYNDGLNNIGIFIVNLKSTKARNLQRNFVSSLLNTYGLDASIVAFYSADTSWRLSFVKKELSFTDKGIKETLTPAKRYSYLVGENESVHTAQEFLFKLLEIDSRKITLEDIEKVFDVEKVTKKFFEEYKEKYLQLKEFLDRNEDFKTESEKCDFTSSEFAKKLMGQIVFLYFLQKKGWLGVQLIPNELTKQEYDELLSSNDKVSQNLITMFYECKENNYTIDKPKLKQANIQDIINFSNIFVKSKYDMPWGTGKKDFIRYIFKQSMIGHRNFFDEYLEPFFYNGLNEKRENQYFPLFNCKIPFLNGGLFEPLNNYRWSSAHFSIPNKLFSNDDKDGILDFLDLYNFTIDEEEPLEKDVAVDPEMLGKIFENLLDVDDRKSKGAFYTPREIVYYMCQESLANYLVNKVGVDYNEIIEFIKYGDLISHIDWETLLDNQKDFLIGKTIYNNILKIDKALIDVKIADPAVGSGAFPLGMLTEIVKIRNNISTYLLIQKDLGLINIEELYNTEHGKRDTFDMKLQTIENCIYAVDIETSAIDIAKLRLWLSLIVDYPNTEEPKPLPNLDCKIMQGNSLVDEYQGVPLFSEKMLSNNLKNYKRNESQLQSIGDINMQQTLFDDTKNINMYMETMLNLQKEYFITSDNKMKKELKAKIDNIQMGLVEESLKNDTKKHESFKIEANKRQKPWFIWKLEFFDVFKNNGGFDIVIGNPPYVSTKGIKEADKQALINIYGFADDLYNHFTFKGLNLLNTHGTLTFITPDTYFTTLTKRNMRKKILENKIKLLVDLGHDIFSSAMVSTSILMVEKNDKNSNNNEMTIINSVGHKSIESSDKYSLIQSEYKSSINDSFYIPTDDNKKINNILGKPQHDLLSKYGKMIETSRDIEKNKDFLTQYRNNLKEKDFTLIGLISEGGQGLATANNGKFIGVKEKTKEANRISITRIKKLAEFNKQYKTNYIMPSTEFEIWNLFEKIKEKYGRDVFGQGYIYKIVPNECICNVDCLSDDEKTNGISTSASFVPYDKGDKDGNRWYIETPYYINWSRENVSFLKKNSGKKGLGMPVVRNPQFYFKSGICYSDIKTFYLRCRKKNKTIHDVKSMSLFSATEKIPNNYLIMIINSRFIAQVIYSFVNNTPSFQINDCRSIPIIVPTHEQLEKTNRLVETAINIQKEYFKKNISSIERDNKLEAIQSEIDNFVEEIYNFN